MKSVTWHDRMVKILDEKLEEKQVFVAKEFSSSGAREFAVVDVASLFQLVGGDIVQSLYEIISPDQKCKLYFDCDLVQSNCLDKVYNVEEYVKALHVAVADALQKRCNVPLEEGKQLVKTCLVLNGSSNTKVSLHLIFPSIVFKNIANVGAFVRCLTEDLMEQQGLKVYEKTWDCNLPPLVYNGVRTIDNKEVRDIFTLMDLQVYSRNQNFRLWNCCKYALKASGERILRCDDFNINRFEMSLITFIVEQEKILECKEIDGAMAVVSKMDSVRIFKHYPKEAPVTDDPVGEILKRMNEDHGIDIRSYQVNANKDDGNPVIMVYTREKNCEWAEGGQHRSNHIYYVVNINRLKFFKLCMATECRGNKSVAVDVFQD